ncbi:hypothetical protein D6817_02420 [Candidatus Pacearchaeota archaeon]|nr:MAG: hypothetical protein D6817_02420 [Candidatus Pacearchaeota archaeon]
MHIKKRWVFVGVAILALVALLGFVFAAHVVKYNDGSTSININEDVSTLINISVNNTDPSASANITEVNVSWQGSSGIAFIAQTQGTDAGPHAFTNTTNLLSWQNSSGLVMNLSLNYFWFNISASVPGEYNLTIATTNASGTTYTNLTLLVNDTTPPSQTDFVSPTEANGSILLQDYIVFNVSVVDNGPVSDLNISVYLYNSSFDLINQTSSLGSSSFYGNFSGLSEGTYHINASARDVGGNVNVTELRTYYLSPSTWTFNGTVMNVEGIPLNNSQIIVSVHDMASPGGFSNSIDSFTTTSNASGWFEIQLPDNQQVQMFQWLFKISIWQRNSTYGYVQYIGQKLPVLPKEELQRIAPVNFFLKEAGTLNITAVNASGDRVNFNYQVKDQLLGYPIIDSFAASEQGGNSGVSELVAYVPKDRAYSIMIFPQESMPVSFNWNNFSSTSSYSFDNGISNYNATTSTLNKQFNITMGHVRLQGYIVNSSGQPVGNWENFTVVPFLLEPGDMVHSQFGVLPYNLSSFFENNSDIFDTATGFFNMSLPATVENSEMLLLASAKNGSLYRGGIANVSFDYATQNGQTINMNITTFGQLGHDNRISMESTAGPGSPNHIVPVKKVNFNFINSTGGALGDVFIHVEATVDYSTSPVNAREFTWMADVQQNENDSISLPILNVSAGIKEMNIFVSSGEFAPISKSFTQSELQSGEINITIEPFEMRDPDGAALTDLSIALYKSNSTCDKPEVPSACVLAGNAQGQNFSEFDPFSVIIGGGKMSFRMGKFSTGIMVHYVNVDLLASGPPTALFDSSASESSTSNTFETAMRFGSTGPRIYDYVIVAMPYTEGSNTTTGLNESADIYVNVTLFYDDNWNVIWNVTANGTNASALAGNFSKYSAHADEWQVLMSGTLCRKDNQTWFNATYPCYVNTSSNLVWVRLPHFSGTAPEVNGQVITAAGSSSSSSSSSSGSSSSSSSSTGATTGPWSTTFLRNSEDLKEKKTENIALAEKQRVKLKVDGETHYVGVHDIDTSKNEVKIEVSSEPQNATLKIKQSKKFEVSGDDYYDLKVKLESISSSKANLTISYLHEKIELEVVPGNESNQTAGNETGGNETAGASGGGQGETQAGGAGTRSLLWLWVILGIIVVVVAVYFAINYYENKKREEIEARLSAQEAKEKSKKEKSEGKEKKDSKDKKAEKSS